MKFENIKVGDKIKVSRWCGFSIQYTEETVTRVSKTQFATKQNRYFKDNGDRVGDRNKTSGWFTMAEEIIEV